MNVQEVKIHEELFEDLGYAVRLTYRSDDYYVEFWAYALVGMCYGRPLYESWDGDANNAVGDTSEAAVQISGSVKWDGCSNFQFDEQERCMLHACDRDGLVGIGTLLGLVHDKAIEMMGERADYVRGKR